MKSALAVLSACFVLSACGGSSSNPGGGTPETPASFKGVVKAITMVPVNMGRHGGVSVLGNSGSLPVSVILDPSASFTLDTSKFVVPAITNGVLDFGSLAISALSDNDLRKCGTSGKAKCTKAYVRIYTTGKPGAGLWNTTDGYGMPITAGLPGTTPLTVGLDAASAAVVQTVNITSAKNVIRLADFAPQAVYQIKSDFTEAGAGAYSTTLVVEYGLLD